MIVSWLSDHSSLPPWGLLLSFPLVYGPIAWGLMSLWDRLSNKPSGHDASQPFVARGREAPNSDSDVLNAYLDLFADRHPAVYDTDLLPAPKEHIRALLGKAIEKETDAVRVDQLRQIRRALDDFGEIEDEDRVLVNLLNGLLTSSSEAVLGAARGGKGIPHKSEEFLALALNMKYRHINEGTFTQEDRESTRETIQSVLAGRFKV